MISMILQMSGMTLIYILLIFFLKKWLKDRPLKAGYKILLGVIFGGMAILSTHFGVDFNHMMVNVRDLGPMSAGLFFDPVSGIIAGIIGGVERYIAGTYWGVGAYTTIACSISTILSGFLAAFLHLVIFRKKRPSVPYGFFMGAVMEVFHMYAVFLTHRNDMDMAFYVVRNCSIPMILFTGLGLAVSSLVISMSNGGWKHMRHSLKREKRTVSQLLQFWLFIVTMIMVVGNFVFTYYMQTKTAEQRARTEMASISTFVKNSYEDMQQLDENIIGVVKNITLNTAESIAYSVDHFGGFSIMNQDTLDELRSIHSALAIALVENDGEIYGSSGNTPLYLNLLGDVLSGERDNMVIMPAAKRICAATACNEGMVVVVFTEETVDNDLNLVKLSDTLSAFTFGSGGTYDIVRNSGFIGAGNHSVTILTGSDRDIYMSHKVGEYFESDLFGIPALCLIAPLDDDENILVRMPISEMYENRDIQAYENTLADILLFTVLYVLISILIQKLVVDNLNRVNKSLGKITAGDLNEVVSVRNSSEFVCLSDDINETVSALKSYIDAAEHRMEEELELARQIQESALPRSFNFPRNDFEIFAQMNPAREVGGDFYDFFFVDSSRLALVIADVSGKGIPASLFMMQSKAAIRGLAEEGLSPSQVLYRANNMLCRGNEAEMFVTAWIGIIDLDTGVMKCANAGHEYPAIMQGIDSFELYNDPHGLVLGAMEGVSYKEYELVLHSGDKLFVYTDGVPEAINENTEQYRTDRMIRKLNELKDLPLDQALPQMRQDILEFAGQAQQFDDITMLAFHYKGE